MANKIASSESLDDDYESDASNESTLSEGALNKSRKLSPKFVSEPNLSILDAEETPKTKKPRLFRSKMLSATSLNKRYKKRKEPIRGTPTCVSCFDDQDTSENDTQPETSPTNDTPKKPEDVDKKLNYLTSTPGVSEAMFEDDCTTPYMVTFRRASMSPITKSTQKLSKAMQVGRMFHVSRMFSRFACFVFINVASTVLEISSP